MASGKWTFAELKRSYEIWRLDRIIKQKNHYDPLTVAWIAYAEASSFVSTHASEVFPGMRALDVAHLLTIGQSWTVKNQIECGAKLGLWDEHSTTHVWINDIASFAFMCMRPILGRDVAKIIARGLARMYLEDLEWLAAIHPKDRYQIDVEYLKPWTVEKLIRDRLLRWLAI